MSLSFFICVSVVILLISVATTPLGSGRVPPYCVAWYTSDICCDMVDVPVPAAVGSIVAISPCHGLLIFYRVCVTITTVPMFSAAPD